MTLQTDTALSVPSSDICPTGGVITVIFQPGGSTAQISHQPDGSVTIESDGDGTVDSTFPNCLDPSLLVCAAG